MDDTRKQVMLAELEDAKKERADLDAYIEVLSARLGIPVESDTSESPRATAQPSQSLPATGNPLDLVYAGEFIGLSFPKAAETVLNRWSPAPATRPLKTGVLVAALQKGGLDVKDARQLYRALWNASRFHNLKGGAWGFAAWYPAAVRSKAKASSNGTPGEMPDDLDGDEIPSVSAEGDDSPDDSASQAGSEG